MMLLKWVSITIIGSIVLVAIGIPIIVTQIEYKQARKNAKLVISPNTESETKKSRAVIVFSRSGNTALLARHIAEQQNADFYRLDALDYALGINGWVNALMDAREGEAVISPEKIDLTQYDTVYLGSPIWLYSPAPPIWQFVANNNFQNKHVVLFNTFNSKFEQEYINEFEQRVRERGAASFVHRFVRRGRMGQQISSEVLLERFDSQDAL